MDAACILDKLNTLGVKVGAVGEELWLEPGSRVPPELLDELRQHKADILNILGKSHLGEASPMWHAENIAEVVNKEGICLFWSELFHEMTAFIKTEQYRGKVPGGIVTYTIKELKELFGRNKHVTEQELKLIHEAKKQGALIISHNPNEDFKAG
jgi:hypothetical protein